MENLPELRDIHLPLGVSGFPPANGWWLLLLAIVVFALLLAFIKQWLRYNKKRYALRLINQTNEENAVLCALQCSEILRRICVHKYKHASALIGNDWADFLNAHCSQKLESNALDLLINAPYLNKNTKQFSINDAQQIKVFCHKFIGENL